MRFVAKSFLIAILIASLSNISAFAADEKPLGLIIQAQEARLGDANVAVGTTVYPGDTLATEIGGTVRMKIGGSQIYLLSGSSATLAQTSHVVRAVVARGTVGFSSNGTDLLALEIPQGILRAADGQPAYGQVTIVSPLEVIISAYRGSLVLDNDGELHTIPAGKSYRVTMDLEPATQPQDASGAGGSANVTYPKHRHLVFDAVVAAGAVGLGFGIWAAVCQSPSQP
jgi:hypothetical protein